MNDKKNVRSAVCYESTLGKQRDVTDMRSFITDSAEDSGTDMKDLDLNEKTLRLIYYDYHVNDPAFRLTLPQFVSFLRKDVVNDPDIGSTINKETKDQIDDMSKFTDRRTLISLMSAGGLADFFEMKESDAKQLLLYYQIKNNKAGSAMSLPAFVSFLINDVASVEEYGKMISGSQLKQLKGLKVYTSKSKMTAKRSYSRLASLLGIDKSRMRAIYINEHAKGGTSSKLTITELASVLKTMSKDPAFKDLFDSRKIGQLIGGLEQIGQMDPRSYSVNNMAKALKGYNIPLDAGSLRPIYAYNDIDSSPSSYKRSAQSIVSTILNDKQYSSALSPMQKKQLRRLKGIIDASVSGEKLSAERTASLLEMKSSDVNKLYLLRQYKSGDTGSWKLTPQQFVNFLVDRVLSDSSMSSKVGGNASDLRFAKKFINAVVAGSRYNYSELSDFLAGRSGNIKKSRMKFLYEFYGSMNRYDENWTMDIMEMVKHLDENMITTKAFAESMDEEQISDVHSMRSDLDEAAALLEGEHYGRMLITAQLPEDSAETRAFLSDLSKSTKADFNEDSYLIGNSPMAWEMSGTFRDELNKITLITALFILLIVLLTFRRLAAPVILVLLIQCAVFITMGLLNFLHLDMYYLALLIVQSIMMGATIDYGIIYTTYYVENRGLTDPKEAIRASYKGSLRTILTSALILTLVVGLLSFAFKEAATQQICRILSVGCLIATLLVIFLLPAMLACVDRFVAPKKQPEQTYCKRPYTQGVCAVKRCRKQEKRRRKPPFFYFFPGFPVSIFPARMNSLRKLSWRLCIPAPEAQVLRSAALSDKLWL